MFCPELGSAMLVDWIRDPYAKGIDSIRFVWIEPSISCQK